LLVCRVAGVCTEGCLLFADGYPTETNRVSNQADRERTAKLSEEMSDRRKTEGNGERRALDWLVLDSAEGR
jgi:hypothetical protein